MTCPSCGAWLPDGLRTCNLCGRPVGNHGEPDLLAARQELCEILDRRARQLAFGNSEPAALCPSCGKPITSEGIRCVNCGAWLNQPQMPGVLAPRTVPGPAIPKVTPRPASRPAEAPKATAPRGTGGARNVVLFSVVIIVVLLVMAFLGVFGRI